jgi:cell division protein FtsI (penicillin-binding protein 3)
MLFVLTLFAGRLVQLQGLDSSVLASQALEKRTMRVVLPAHRGDITDASGAVLATTVERRDVLVDQTLVARYKRHVGEDLVPVGLRGAAEDLGGLLGVPVPEMVQRLTGRSLGAVVAKGVSPEVARRVMRLAVPGVATTQASRRVYPAGTTAANVLGFLGTDRALGGIEQKYDALLSGTPGSVSYERGADGAQIPTGVASETDPVPGSSVRLTLVRDLQWKAQELMTAQVKATKAEAGFAVALDVRTGEVLALASVPTFDPNAPSRARPEAFSDRSLLDVFEPGSTAKVATMAAALEEGAVTPRTRMTIPPSLHRSDATFRDAEVHGTEKLTLAGVLAQSSNIGTILAGEKISPETLHRYLRAFGLGESTGIGLAESPGILAPPDQWSGSQRYTVMFGQGLSVNALQAAGVFATVANDGVRVPPRVVAGRTDPQGVFHPEPAPPSRRVVSAATARDLRLMMEKVVGEHGTAVKAAIPGYRVAGKTGTAYHADGKGGYNGYTSSFIGLAPADAPRIVVAVVLQKPTRGHYGGEVAAPVFQQLMTYALAERRVPPTGTPAPALPLRWR